MLKKVFLFNFLLLIAESSFSQVLVPFTQRYQVTQRGGQVFVANSILTCNGGAACTTAQNEIPPAGTGIDNNTNSQYIDIDGDASTFSSSSANLNLPACSKVTFAGLYWGAYIDLGNAKYAQRSNIKIKSPGASSYTTLTADTFYDNNVGYDFYNCFVDVTSIVVGAGNGTYTMADVVSRTGGTNQWAGWGMVVVYRNDLLQEKNITVYDGVGSISSGATAVTINVSGFYTPPSGAVNFELGEIAYDGDRSSTGDSLFFKGAASFIAVSDAIHPVNDVFNSTIGNNGVEVLTRNPAYRNTLGFDANIFKPNNAAKNYLPNGATSADIKVTTGGEQIFLQTITSAIDTYEPHFSTVKTVADVNGGSVNTGDTLLYTITLNNSGNDTSVTTSIVDTLPFNADYVPNSVVITSGPNAGAKTDIAGDDQARLDTSAGYNIIKVNLGTNANATTGGGIPHVGGNSSTAFTFKMKVTDDCTKLLCNPTISNRLAVNYKGFISGIQRQGFSSPSLLDSLGCPADGYTSTTVTVPVSCSPPPDSSIGGCFPLKFDSVPGIRPGYVYYNSSWVSVTSASSAGTYYGIRSLVGVSCKDTIRYTLYQATVTASNAGPDQNLCNVTSTTLAANTPTTGSGKWTLVSGPNVPSFSANTSPTSGVTGMITGTYQFRWTISLKCDSSSDIVIVNVYATTTASNAGPDQNLCNVTSTTLAGNSPTAGTGSWSLVSGPNSPTITTPSSPTSSVTGMVAGIYTFRWTISNGVCAPSTDDVQITIYSPPTTSNAGADQSLCNVNNTVLSGNAPVIGTGNWTMVSGPNSPTITAPGTANTSVTGMIAGVYVFRWSITNGVCAASTDDIQVTIYATPTVSNAGPDQSLCNVSSVTLAGNTPAAGSGTWTWISGPNTPSITTPSSPTSTITGMIAGVYVFRWTISNGVCATSTSDVQITIYALPTTSIAGANQNLCNVTSTTLAGNNPASGTGLWSVISGPNSPTITSPTSPASTVTGMIPGVYTLRWTITNGVCASSTDDVQITIYSLPTVSNAGPDQSLCNITTTTLSGNSPASGSGTWSIVSGPNSPTIAAPGSPNTNVNGMINGVYVFRWTISNGSCATSTDDVQITIYTLPTSSNAGPDQNLCNVNNIILAANNPVIGTGNWSMVSGPNTPTITTPSSPTSTVTGMIAGTYIFRWSITNGSCATSTDDVQIINYDLPTVSNAGADQNLCNVITATFTGNTALVGTGNWSIVSGPNAPTITTPSSPTSTITGIISGVYVFRWTISNGVCATSSDDVQITIYTLPTVSNAGPDQNLCNVNTTVLSGNTPASGTGVWTMVSGPNSPTITAPGSANTSVTGMIAGVYVFRWSISNGVCATSTDDIQVTIYSLPTVSNAGPDQNVCNVTSATFAGNTPVVGTGTWALVSGPNTPTITTPSSPTSTVTGMIAGVYIFSWTISNGVCAASSNNVQITIYDLPTVSAAGPDQNLCNVNNTTLAGNAPVIGTGIWTLISGPNSPTITTPSSPSSTITGMIAGVYTLRWTISNGVCATSTDDVQITIFALPTVSNAGADQSLCNVVSTTMAGNTPVVGTGNWTLVSGPNTPTITTPNSPVSTLTGMIPGVYILRWTITNGVCAVSSNDVQITNFDLPTPSNAGADQGLCNVTTTTLVGNTPVFGSGTWTLISGPNLCLVITPFNPTTTVTGMITGVYTFRWTVTNGVCASSTDDVQVTIYALPTIANAGPDQSLCNVTSITLAGNNPTVGTKSWSLVSGPNAPLITSPGTTNSTVTGMIAGVYIFRWTISNGTCAPSTDDVQITIYDLPTVSNAGPDQSVCNTDSVTLAANAPVTGTGLWSFVSGPNTPTISDNTDPATIIKGMIPGVYVFSWTISNGVCAVSADSVQITIYNLPTVSVAGLNQDLCNVTDVTLAGNAPVFGNGIWTIVSGPNIPFLTDTTNPLTIVTGLIPGVYIFRWTISNGVCAPSFSDVQITNYNLPAIVDAGPDQELCYIDSATMAGNVPGLGTGTWLQISGPNTATIVSPNDPSTVITGMVIGTYQFGWMISNGVCFSYTDTVLITIYDLPTVSVAGPDQDVCSVTSVNLSGNAPSVGTGQWSLVSGPNVPTITDPDSANTTVTSMITGVYVFRWTITSGVCAPSTSDVQVTIYNIPLFIDAGPDQALCNIDSVTMAANTPAIGTGTWTYISGPNSPSISTITDPTTTITGMIAGTYQFGWAITNGVCVSPTDTITVNIYDLPTVADAGPDQSLCNVDSAIMTANAAATGFGAWALISGPNLPVIADSTYEATTIRGMIAGTYIFSWTISNGVCAPTSDTVIINIYDLPTIANAGPDQSLCNTDSVVMAGNSVITGSGLWTTVSGPNVPLITNSSDSATSITNLIPGNYLFAWTISNGICSVTSDTVEVIVYALSTVADAGVDQDLCNVTATAFTGNTPVNGTGIWSLISGPNTPTIAVPALETSPLSDLIQGAYIFTWTITNGVCASAIDTVQITMNELPTGANAGVDQLLCADSVITLAGNYVSSGSGLWTLSSGPNIPTIVTPTDSNSVVTGLIPGDYIFNWTITNGACTVSSDSVLVRIYVFPPVVDAGPDQNLCNVTTISLSGNIPAYGTGTWTLISGPNTPTISSVNSPSTSVTGIIAGTYVFAWNVVNGTCSAFSDSVTITINDLPTVADAGPDQSLCNITTTNLIGNTVTTGTGIWTLISGPNLPTIVDPDSATTSVTGMAQGTYVFSWTISNGICSVSSDTISVSIFNIPLISDAGPDQNLCNTDSAVMAGSVPASGIGTWSLSSGPNIPVFTSQDSSNTSVTGMIPGTYVFGWTINNGVCSTPTDLVTISIDALPTVSDAGPDQELCNDTVVLLSGNTPLSGTGMWSLASGPNSPLIISPSSASTNVENLIPGIYVFYWTISNGVCSASVDSVQITVYDLPTMADAGPDQDLCNTDSTSLASNTPSSGSGYWTFLSGPNIPFISDSTSATTNVTGMITGTYRFIWNIGNGTCTPFTDTVQVNINALPTTSDAGPFQDLCNGGTAIMNGNVPTIGTGTWTFLSGPNIPVITTPNDPSTLISGMIKGTYVFSWDISNGSCAISNDTVSINMEDILTPADAGSDQILCNLTLSPMSTILSGNVPASGFGKWTLENGPNVPVISSDNSPTTNVSGLIDGDYTFAWTISNGVCASFTDEVLITVHTLPATIYAGPDQQLCNIDSASMSADSAAAGTGLWVAISGPNSPVIQAPSSPSTRITGMIPGTYLFGWALSNSVCTTQMDTVAVTVYALPTVANAGAYQEICHDSIATLTANTPMSGTGRWSIVSGPSLATITNNTDPSSTVTNLLPGIYIFRWTISNGMCDSSADDVQISIYDLPSAPSAGTDQSLCGDTTAILSGNLPAVGIGNWSFLSGPNTPGISCAGCPSTLLSNLVTGIYLMQWTITSGTCASVSDSVQITRIENPDVPDAGADVEICYGDTAFIKGNIPLVGNGQWSIISGPVNPVITSVDSAETSVTGLDAGTYILRWTTSNGICSRYDDMQITVHPRPVLSFNSTVFYICVGQTADIVVSGANTYSWSPTDHLNNSSVYNPIAVPPLSQKYIVTGIDLNGCKNTDSVNVVVCDTLIIPDGFSPDGDGINDYFEIVGIENYPDNSLHVYNRWGNLIYQKVPYDNTWDAIPNVNGMKLGIGKVPAGTYYYLFELGRGRKNKVGYLIIRY